MFVGLLLVMGMILALLDAFHGEKVDVAEDRDQGGREAG